MESADEWGSNVSPGTHDHYDDLGMQQLQIEEKKLTTTMISTSNRLLDKLKEASLLYEQLTRAGSKVDSENASYEALKKLESELTGFGSYLLETQVEYLTLFKKQKPTDPYDLYEIKCPQENDQLLPENWMNSDYSMDIHVRLDSLNKETELVKATNSVLKVYLDNLTVPGLGVDAGVQQLQDALCDTMAETVCWMKKNVAIVRYNPTSSAFASSNVAEASEVCTGRNAGNEEAGKSVAQQMKDLLNTLTIPESELGKSYPNFLSNFSS